jgi:hypothetical protein
LHDSGRRIVDKRGFINISGWRKAEGGRLKGLTEKRDAK